MSSQSKIVNIKTSIGAYVQSGGELLIGEKSYDRIPASGGLQSLNSAFGGPYVTFPINKAGVRDYLTDAKIFYQISAITAGTGATYTYFVNGIMVNLHDHIDLVSKNQTIATIYADQIWENLYRYVDSDHFELIAQNIGYNTSTTQRATLAQSPQCLSLDLKYLFNHMSKPIDISLYPELKIRCFFRNSQNMVINTDSTTNPSFTFLQAYLSCEYTTAPDPILNENRNLVISKNPPEHYDISYLLITKPLLSGSTTYTLDLGADLEGKNVIDIAFNVRLQSNINTNFTSNYFDNNQPIYSFALKSNNNFINNLQSYEIYSQDYLCDMLPRFHYEGIKQILNITNCSAVISFSADHQVSNFGKNGMKYRGSRIFTEKDTQLNLTFASNLASNCTCTIMVRCAQLSINKEGQLYVF